MCAINGFRCALLGLSILTVGALFSLGSRAAPEPAEPVNPAPHVTQKIWQEGHFVLGEITDATRSVQNDKGSITNNITFHVKVAFDNTSVLTGHEITIMGPEFGMNASLFGWNMPDLTIGDTSVFRLAAMRAPDTYVGERGGIELPIGLVTGARVDPKNVEGVQEALALTSKYLPVKDAKKTHDDAVFLFKSKNYYLCALGALILGSEGTNDDETWLESGMMSDDCSIDKFLWLSEQLVRQRPEEQIAIYRQYMQKHSQHLLEPVGG